MEETKEIIDVEYEELLSDMPRDINTITTEILLYKNQAGEAILEIGKRLIEVKAQLGLAANGWTTLRSVWTYPCAPPRP